jgi:hypothetical protein
VAIDPVTGRAFRTPAFIVGTVMLVAGLVPLVLVSISGWKGISAVSWLSVFAPIGAILMALARSKASQEWRQGR